MKSSADRSSASASKPAHATAKPFFGPAGRSTVFAPAVQMKMEVSKPGDPFEKEADHMAGKVMRMASPAPVPAPPGDDKLQKSPDEKLQKEEKEVVQKAAAPEKEIQKAKDDKLQKAPEAEDKLQKQDEEKLQRKEAGGAGAASSSVQSAITGKMTGGQPMSSEVRGFMEPRFNADFSNVRIHNDPEAASLNNQLSARAFTHKNHIFFSRDQYQPGTSGGKHLLAHELTHTIQQGHAVQRAPQVSTTSTPPPVQRLGIQDALDYFADKAANIPGFTMLTVIIGFNPINQRSVDRSAANILRAMVEMVPGGHMISQALDNHGIFNRVGTWAEQQFATLGDIGSDIVSGLRRFIDSLSWTDIFDLGGVWDRAKSIFTSPIRRLISFATSLVSQILGFIREAILRPLAALAEGTRGYDLLKALLGQDPITGEAVPRTPDVLIGGFMKLIGQEEIWENIKKGNAIAKAWAWFQGTLAGLLGLARSIPQKIIQTLASLTIMDLVTVVGAFRKIGSAFLGIAGEFGSWALGQVISLLEILFSVVAPGVMPYLKKAQAAFTTILKNPIGFVGNLVRAAKLGFQRFAGNIVTHLKTALIKWLVGPLAEAGVYIPKSFSLTEIVKLVLSVLGLTWQNIRAKLVKIIPEPVLVGLEKTAGILVTLVKDGPAAAWEQIKTELSELKDQLIAQVTQMVSVEIVKAAVMKLVSMINPAGAVIQAIIAIYNTISFFIEKASQIAAVVGSFINSIAAIAAGQVDAAAGKVEQTLANTLTLVISFLAKFVGLGGIPAKLVGIVWKIRKPIDKGLDKIVAWLGKMLGKLKAAVTEWWKSRKPFTTRKGERHEVYYSGSDNKAIPMVASNDPKPIANKLDEFTGKLDSLPADKKGHASTLIASTRKTLQSNPGDSSIVASMQTLFELFEGDQTGQPKKAEYTPMSGTLPGDSTVVGKAMKIDWLSTDFIASHPGSVPGSGQDALMSKLVVDKKNRSAFKYIRGHLLNENLGGEGKPENLFPITANANSQHLHSTEKEIKNWVGTPGTQNQGPKQYAFYEVKVDYKDSDVQLANSDISLNKVDSTLHTRVLLKDETGAVKKSFMTSIMSRYEHKEKAERFDLKQ
ncbi:DUF4157 domain-containing protein [Chlorobaculum sp. MV4-Y]|uniref:eCIS core domain-containing protein n=1 Tax=Chlorobaculum sp. MV4-Y TaxID=2976335 RepID=UPI0021AF4123|nr:DUF4157 domain-containing protein [Chlorobaculum sp. MV4-Y]UWX56721.1 DUF4157 domain-containing protein [Chlorobaculum sp. MV4-Y]